jgi:hypothetical protein
MTAKSKSESFDDVFRRELQEILKRRREANLKVEADEAGNPRSPEDSLVGLALSGGGVRSAAFNLGLLQALHDHDVLRHIDYMSTVSGGGYVGASLSSLALHPQTDFGFKTKHHETTVGQESVLNDPSRGTALESGSLVDRFSLTSSEDGRQPPRVLELIHGGGYLRRPLIFLNRYLIGVILTNIVALSMVFALAALTAWMFRWLDDPWVSSWVQVLGFRGDAGRAFFPTVLFFALWLLMWAVSYWRSGSQAEGRVARWFMTLTIVSFLLACAALLGTGDIDLTHLRDQFGIEIPTQANRWITGDLKMLLLVALSLALLPYLRIRDLLRSGTHPRTAIEGWIFAIASRALLYGIPIVVFGWLARENISYFDQNRNLEVAGQRVALQHNITPVDFVDWNRTWQELTLLEDGKTDSVDYDPAGLAIWRAVSPAKDEPADPSNDEASRKVNLPGCEATVTSSLKHHDAVSVQQAIRDSIKLQSRITEFEKSTSFLRRWVLYLGYLFTPDSPSDKEHPLKEQVTLRLSLLEAMKRVCDHLNETVLVNPKLYCAIAQKSVDPPVGAAMLASDSGSRQVFEAERRRLIENARLLERKIKGLEVSEDSFHEWVHDRESRLKKLLAASDSNGSVSQQAFFKFEEDRKEFVNVEAELKENNWRLLQLNWREHLTPRGNVYSYIVLKADQAVRWSWLVWSLAIFLLASCVVNMNATSLHGFYRKMLSRMWITEIPGLGRTIPLARLETVAKGAPYHLISAAIRMIGLKDESLRSETDVFIFSQAFCGSNRTGYVPTEQYMAGRLDLSNAIAISGAAVTPTQVHNPLLAVLLMLSNSRLGQWLPNPSRQSFLPSGVERLLEYFPAVPLRLMFGALQRPEDRNYCFVSDGGHHENLGIEPLLQRRCRVIIASDVTYDRKFEFTDFVRLLRRMRFEFGIRILGIEEGSTGVPLEKLTPEWIVKSKIGDPEWVNVLSDENLAKQHYIVARILYPEGVIDGSPSEGRLIYIKPNFDGDEAVDLTRYQVEDPSFPHDHTSDQFYDPQKFESYRQLGFHIGRSTYEKLFASQAMSGHHDEPLGKWALTEMRSSIADPKA